MTTKSTYRDIIEFYEKGNSLKRTSKQFKLSVYQLKKLLLSANVPLRTRYEQNVQENMRRAGHMNHNYFHTIDTDEKAYYLGVLAANCCVYQKGNTIKVGLSSVDEAWLQEFKQTLGIQNEIKHYTTNNGFDVSELRFSSLQMKNDLAQYSVVPRKTYKGVSMQNVPPKHRLAWIKGFFDGDGSFTYNKNTKQCRVRFCCYAPTANVLFQEIKEELKDYKGAITWLPAKDKVAELVYSTTPAIKLMEAFEKLDTPCLVRKYTKFHEYFKLRI